MSTTRRAPLFAVVAVLAGCTSIDGLREDHADEMGALLRRLEAVRTDLAARPMLDSDAEPDTIDGKGLVFWRTPEKPAGAFAAPKEPPPPANVALVFEEDLVEPGTMARIPVRVKESDFIPRCAALAKHGTLPWDPDQPEAWWTPVDVREAEARIFACGAMTHVVVLRVTRFLRPVPPTTLPYSVAYCNETTCTFEGGELDVDVHVYQLEPLVRRASFRVSARSSEKVTTYAGDSEALKSAAFYVDDDFEDRLPVALRDAIWKQMKGSRGAL